MSYPLATLALTVDDTGASAPSYNDTLASLQASAQLIYGSDINLDPDSQDGQLLALFAQAIYDVNMAAINVYNSFSPQSAQGAALSSLVKINGLERNASSFSTVDLDIAGTAGAEITDGVANDGIYEWALPSTVTIGTGGSVTVQATCKTAGAIDAVAGTITNISTPTRGWQTVNNPAAATPGNAIETDAALRIRQGTSTALPSQTVIDGIVGAVGNVTGVVALKAYENSADTADSNGIPAHSICLVVDGGDPVAIATAIANKKTPGSGTYGTTSETVTGTSGVPVTISFYLPSALVVTVSVTITALTGYVSTTGDAIIAAVVAYVNGLGIGGGNGQAVEYDAAIAAAKNVANSDTFKITALTITGGSPDLTVAFNEQPSCDASTGVTLTVN